MLSRTEGLQDLYYRREGDKIGEFRYFLPDGSELENPEELERIAKLAVPPGYCEVYISPDPEAELQAFGRDAKGRLQYRYHPDFVQTNAESKWRRLARFAGSLGQMRAMSGADLRRSGLEPRKVMALMTRLLYIARFRVGSDAYAKAHKTYGLTTLRQRHAKVEGNIVEFKFKGKHGIFQHKLTTDSTLAKNISALQELPGPWLFQALTEAGCCRVHAHELNAYIREIMGPFSAKDFRTWGGTLVAAEFLAEAGPPQSDRQAKKTLVECVKYVAEDLGNTAAVTRAHYISPKVFDFYLEGRVLDDFEPKVGRTGANSAEGLTRSELALKRMLETRVKKSKA
ncbi:MAG: topoisomerase I [Meiothermus sp.]